MCLYGRIKFFLLVLNNAHRPYVDDADNYVLNIVRCVLVVTKKESVCMTLLWRYCGGLSFFIGKPLTFLSAKVNHSNNRINIDTIGFSGSFSNP